MSPVIQISFGMKADREPPPVAGNNNSSSRQGGLIRLAQRSVLEDRIEALALLTDETVNVLDALWAAMARRKLIHLTPQSSASIDAQLLELECLTAKAADIARRLLWGREMKSHDGTCRFS